MSHKQAFTIQEVSKSYGEMRALSPLSLQINDGEIVALIGPSGAGKTTLLNILANNLKPDKGKIFIGNKASEQYSTSKQLAKKVGMIRQHFDLVGSLPVIHNVLAGKLGDWGFFKSAFSLLFPQEKEVASKALERVGLLSKIYERTSKLSGGEQQRVALARLLVQHPEIILADEPVSSLDPARSEDVISMLVNLVKEENQTLVASLHSVQLAKKYFSRIIALKEGSIFFDLPTDKVTNQALQDLYELSEMKKDGKDVLFS